MKHVQCAGNWHYTADGQRIAYSLVNNAASDFSIPPQYNALKLLHKNTLKGYDAASDYNPQTSHFLALCMKVVYEKELVIKVRVLQPLDCPAATPGLSSVPTGWPTFTHKSCALRSILVPAAESRHSVQWIDEIRFPVRLWCSLCAA